MRRKPKSTSVQNKRGASDTGRFQNRAQQNGFAGFFQRHQHKVNPKSTVSNTLTQFAEEDLKRIAVLIQKWLQADAKEQQKTQVRKERK